MKTALFHGIEELQFDDIPEPPAGSVNTLKIVLEIEPVNSDLDSYDAFDVRRPGWLKSELKPAVS
ncbi:hypothetical protein ACFPL7_04940 [Dongia soli]|uniref:Alcohol dehydrogenase n=1 Tax=Dongia soli TaxID=600628 RepID=A0ABU5EEF7_9PROT|nr:hypothetical protein [Dongia soli]MDY0884744.1 hypothetical protein [Dongia soli]